MTQLIPTELTKVRRVHKRGSYDREVINAILDATPLCHVGYVIEGKPAVTPTLQWREGDHEFAGRHNVCDYDTIIQMEILAKGFIGKHLRYKDLIA